MRRHGVFLLAGVLLLVGCSIPHPKNSHGVTKIAATKTEAERVYDQYRSLRERALKALDAQPLTAVETGAVLAIDTGSLRVARRLQRSKQPDDTQDLRIVDVSAPRLEAYPMWFVAVVDDEVRDLVKVQVFQRASSTAPWLLAASPETLPSTDLPTLHVDGGGALEPVDPYRSGRLSMSPQHAVRAYAAALNAPHPAAGTTVSPGSFVKQMRAVAREQRSIDGVTFTQHWSARPVQYAVRLADGGALVFGTLSRVDRYQIESGRYIDWPEGSDQKAFLSGKLYNSGELRYYHQILVYVPTGDGMPVVLGQYGGVVEGAGY